MIELVAISSYMFEKSYFKLQLFSDNSKGSKVLLALSKLDNNQRSYELS